MARIKRITLTSVGKVWKNWKPHIVLVGRKMVPRLWKTIWQYFKMLNTVIIRSINCTPRYIPTKNIKRYSYTKVYSIIHNSKKSGKPNVHKNEEWILECGMYVQ